MTTTASKGRWVLAVPLVLVNLAAVWGQAGWAYDNITTGGIGGFLVAALFAGSVESTGIYLAWESHEALMADQAAALLRAGSYAVGLLAGVLNFLHFAPHSLATGVAFGALSAVSPWLWGIWSRARNRARLAELGLVDARGTKLSIARKVWHPVRSVKVMSWAAWAGVVDPVQAVTGWQAEQDTKQPAPSPTPGTASEHEPVPESEPTVEREAPPVHQPAVAAAPVVRLVKTAQPARRQVTDAEASAQFHRWVRDHGRLPGTKRERRAATGCGGDRADRLAAQLSGEPAERSQA
jgi:hypothetical protein